MIQDKSLLPSVPLKPSQFSVILDSVAAGIFTVDMENRITSFNHTAEQTTGISKDRALGRRCWEIFKSDICEIGCPIQQAIRTDTQVVNKSAYIVNAFGDRLPVGITAAPLREGDQIIGGVETFRDLSQVETLRKKVEKNYSCEDILSRNHRMQEIFETLPIIAASPSTVLVEGESGTGKELVAHAIHNLSPRVDKPFVALNCGALPDTLLESELFGYKAGAFTDAKKDKPGRFARAEGGTLFLDEIGDISPALQVRLLRVLQERVYEPLGSTASVKTDVRIVVATNQNLKELVRQGKFRQDLYYRINVIEIVLPPLRARKEDIPLLTDHFIARFNHIQNKDIVGISNAALEPLMAYDFPGNIRELENVIEHAFVLCAGGFIEVGHLPPSVRPPSEPAFADLSEGTSLENMEKLMILDTLRRSDWNRSIAAQELGVHKSTLFRKIKIYGIELPDIDGRSSQGRKKSFQDEWPI